MDEPIILDAALSYVARKAAREAGISVTEMLAEGIALALPRHVSPERIEQLFREAEGQS